MNFQLLVTALLSLLLFSCSKQETPEVPPCHQVEYEALLSIEPGETYCFDDGTELSIISLENGFCPCNLQCIWQGQLGISMEWTLTSGERLEYFYNTEHEILGNEPLPDGLSISHTIGDLTAAEDCTESVPSPEIIEARIIVSKL